MKLIIVLLMSALIYAPIVLSCGSMCPEPHKSIYSGKISDIKVIKTKNPPSSTKALYCSLSITYTKTWKGSKLDDFLVLTSWEPEYCKNRYVIGERILILDSPDPQEVWLKDTIGHDRFIVSSSIYQKNEMQVRLDYLKTASQKDLQNIDNYCDNVLRNKFRCNEFIQKPEYLKVSHPAIQTVSRKEKLEKEDIGFQVYYRLNLDGEIKSYIVSEAQPMAKYDSRISKIMNELKFDSLTRNPDGCFKMTLHLDKKIFSEIN